MMKLGLKAFVFGGALFFNLASAAGECLLNFNVYGPIYAPQTFERTHEFLKEIKREHPCEVLHFQEAWNASQIQQIESAMKERYQVYAPNSRSRIGIMSLMAKPWDKVATYTYRVNYDEGFLDRARRWVDSKKAFSTVFGALKDTYLVNTHLHPSSIRVRLTQIMDLLYWRMKNPEGSLILSGDFNFYPGSVEHQFLMLLLGVEDSVLSTHGSYPKDFCTYCGDNPLGWLEGDFVFDYIFTSRRIENKGGWKPLKTEVVLTGNLAPYSDHYGLKMKFASESENSTSWTEEDLVSRLETIFLDVELELKSFDEGQDFLTQVYKIREQLRHRAGPYWDYLARLYLPHKVSAEKLVQGLL